MNGSMIDIPFMINPLASEMSQTPSSGFKQEGVEEASFLGYLLGAMVGGEEGSAFSGAIQLISEVSQEIAWPTLENRLSCLLGNVATQENTQTGSAENALEEILGALSEVGEEGKQPGLLLQMNKEKGSDHVTLAHGNWKTDPGNKTAVLTTPKGTQARVDGHAITSEAAMNETEEAFFPEDFGQDRSEPGKGVHEEILSKTLQDLGRRPQTNGGKTDGPQQLQRVGLTDGVIHEAKSKEGMTQLISTGEEASHPQFVDPSAMGEGVATRARPVPVFLADGLMEQVLETLNLKTWKVGQRELRIQLQPPELGRLHMKIGLEEHQVVLKIQVENPFVKDLIENNLAQLRQSLQDQGLRMDKCAVTVGDHFQHEFSRNGDNSEGFSDDYAMAVEEGEIEESPLQRARSAYQSDSDLVNVFI